MPWRSGRSYVLWALVAAAVSVAAGGTARAEATAAERETARSLMDEADALRVGGDAWGALERYLAAHQLMRVPTTGLEVARTQQQLSLLVEACATAIEVANSVPAPDEPSIFAEARAAAQVLVEELRPQVPSLTVHVEPIGVAYELRVDGALVPEGARALPYKLNPDVHTVRVQAAGYRSVTETVTLVPSQRLELRVRLIRNTPPPPLAKTLQPKAAESCPMPCGLAPRDSAEDADNAAGRTRGYVGLGVGGTVFAVGVVTGILAVVQTEEAKASCVDDRCPRSTEPEISRANTLSNVANVTLPLGLLGVGYGVFELLTHRDAPSRSTARVGFSGTSVSLRGEL